MAAHNDQIPALAPDALSSDRIPDHVAIFSPPAVSVVMHWWAESNRRWAERDRVKALMVQPVGVTSEGPAR